MEPGPEPKHVCGPFLPAHRSLLQTFFVESICVDPEVIAANIVVSGAPDLVGTVVQPRWHVTVRSLSRFGLVPGWALIWSS